MALTDQQIDSLAQQAIERARSGDFPAAESLFARAVEARPNAGQLLHLLGQARLKLGRFAEAREPLQRAAQFLPREVAAQVNLAGCLAVLGEHAGALAALERAARLKPGDAAIAHNRGRALEALGRAEEAERAYDEALAIDHRLQASLSARANLLSARGDWMGALADLDMALTDRPGDAGLRLKRGEILLQQGDWLRGLPDYEARLELPGRHQPALPRWQGESLSGKLLLYSEQADIDSDEARRDTLMFARGIDTAGVDTVVECSVGLAEWLDLPNQRRGAALDGFAAAVPLRSLPHLLGWTIDSLPKPPALKRAATPGSRTGWFTATPPPTGLEIERDPAKVVECRRVVGDDTWPVHLAARLGLPTILILTAPGDWAWAGRDGKSPWYADLEIVRDPSLLASRLV